MRSGVYSIGDDHNVRGRTNMKIKRFCVVCEKQLMSAGTNHGEAEMELHDPPDNGVHFTTSGNWGSTVFDTWGSSYLEGNICDECLKDKADKGLLVEVVPDRSAKPPHSVSTWDRNRHAIEHAQDARELTPEGAKAYARIVSEANPLRSSDLQDLPEFAARSPTNRDAGAGEGGGEDRGSFSEGE